jgi:hypothetical protein
MAKTGDAQTRPRETAQSAAPPAKDGALACTRHGRAGQHQALADSEDDESGSDAVLALSEVMDGEQRGCRHQCDPIDSPGKPAQ